MTYSTFLTYRSCLLLGLGLLILSPMASAQGYIDQIAVAHLLNRRADSLTAVPEVAYDYYVLANPSGNSVYARNIFFNWLGKGDSKKSLEMALLFEMLNRVSTLSPPGEDWEMYWVVNFHQARGMHIHQYEMPTGGPTSHGCVRLVDADAEWVFGGADPWQTTARGDGYASRLGRLLKQGTTVLVLGVESDGRPQPFAFTNDGLVLKPIELPADPYDVPPGSSQQKLFDRLRKPRSSR